jgi:hypothetical protein
LFEDHRAGLSGTERPGEGLDAKGIKEKVLGIWDVRYVMWPREGNR